MSFPVFQRPVGTLAQTSPFGGMLENALKAYSGITQAQYQRPTLQEALIKAQQYNKYYGPNIESEMALRGAQAGHLGALTQAQQEENKYLPKKLQQMQQQRQFGLDNPLFGAAGTSGDIGRLFYLQKLLQNHPEMAGNLNPASQESFVPSVNQNQANQLPSQETPGMNINLNDLIKSAFMKVARGGEKQFSPSNTLKNLEALTLSKKGINPSTMKPFANESEQSSYINALSQSTNSLGKEQAAYMASVQADNPNLSPDKAREAANIIANGGNELSDGTSINASPLTMMALDRAVKLTTTAQQINNQLNANKAEYEIETLQQYADKGLKPYGDTFNNMSPAQIMDSFKSDQKSQNKLGQFIASQALQYEIAQQRIKLANGQPGITSTQELMHLSGQIIDTKFPRLSYAARHEASRYLNEALKAGNKARQSIGLGPSAVTANRANTTRTNSIEGQTKIIKGKTYQVINGDWHEIH